MLLIRDRLHLTGGGQKRDTAQSESSQTMLANLRSCPLSSFSGPLLLDTRGLPRYWAAVWSLFLPVDLVESTLRSKLSHVESFYKHADETLGAGELDDALADCNLDILGSALESYFISIRNRPNVSAASEDRWQAALQFVIETVRAFTRSTVEWLLGIRRTAFCRCRTDGGFRAPTRSDRDPAVTVITLQPIANRLSCFRR
jgi:hypothetical protein